MKPNVQTSSMMSSDYDHFICDRCP